MTDQLYLLDDDGSVRAVQDLVEWAAGFKKLSQEGRWNIAHDVIVMKNISLSVSTIFLGINHDHAGQGRLLVFETMVLGLPIHPVRRYSSKAEALSGHQEIVRAIHLGQDLREVGMELSIAELLLGSFYPRPMLHQRSPVPDRPESSASGEPPPKS